MVSVQARSAVWAGCQRTDKPLETSTPQPEQVWLVYAGWTATTHRPAHAALKVRMLRNCSTSPHPDALGEMVVLEHVGRLQVLVIDRVVAAHQRQRRLVVEVLPLAPHLLMRLRQQRRPPCGGGCCPSCDETRGAARFSARARPCDTSREEDARAIRERGEGLDAQVNPRFLPVGGKRLHGHFGARDSRHTSHPLLWRW